MIKNYLITALRSLQKQKVSTFINLFGLISGTICATFLLLYIRDDLQVDKHHKLANEIHRVSVDLTFPTGTQSLALSSGPVGPALNGEFPEVLSFCRISRPANQTLFEGGDQRFYEHGLIYADSNIFELFDFPLSHGKAEEVLKTPNGIVLSERLAQKYFPKEEPIGKTIQVGSSHQYKVSGIMENPTHKSHISFDAVIPISSFSSAVHTNWNWYPIYTYLQLSKEVNTETFVEKLPAFLERREASQISDYQTTLMLTPLTDIYLYSNKLGEFGAGGNPTYLYIFTAIALLIILIACVNFINLSTAQSVKRALEVGIRKAVGAPKSQLIFQFLLEAVLISSISFFLAGIVILTVLPEFNFISGKEITFTWMNDWYLLLMYGGVSVVLGLLAGIYPAFILAGYKPIDVLKSNITVLQGGLSMKRILVVFQFAISMILTISVVTIFGQVHYLRTQETGFDQAQTVVVNFSNNSEVIERRELFIDQFEQIPGVTSSTFSSHLPGEIGHTLHTQVELPGGLSQSGELDLYLIDYDFVEDYDLDIVAGRAFSRDFQADTLGALILNETAIRILGYSSANDAIGQEFVQWGRTGKIVGVMKDFHYRSLHQEVTPLSFQLWPQQFEKLSIKLSAGQITESMDRIEDKWAELMPQLPFDYYFLDEAFDRQYQSDIRFSQVFSIFTVLALIIANLGLFALCVYQVNLRLKEIGIRKVLGAKSVYIFWMLTRNFMGLLFIAFILATPISYMLMDRWLSEYAFRIPLEAWIFGAALGISVIIALGTVFHQVWKAASLDPIRFLRHE